MEFEKLVRNILSEDVVAGGEGSAFGPNADQPYGDSIGSDARNVFYYSGVYTRKGKTKSKVPKRKTKRKKK